MGVLNRFSVVPKLAPKSRASFTTSFLRRPARGLSLIELNMVVATIAIIALMMVPGRAPANVAQIDGVLNEVAQALRFTRDLAARSEQPHGLRFNSEGQLLRVFRVEDDAGTYTAKFDVYDPLKKSLYELELPREARAFLNWNGRSGADPVTSVFNDGQSPCLAARTLVIEPDGTTRCFNPYGGRLEGVEVRLGSATYTRALRLDPFTSTISAD